MRRAFLFVSSIAVCGAFALFVACSSPYTGAVEPDEAGANGDALADAFGSDATSDALVPFCETVDATFCDDFETLTDLDGSFVLAQTGGTIFFTDGGAPASPLHSVRGAAPATDDGGFDGGSGVSSAALGKQFSVFPQSTLTLDADLRIVQGVPVMSTTLLYALALIGPAPNPSVYLNVVPGGISVYASGPAGPVSMKAASPISLGSWFHVRIEVHRAPADFVTVSIGGATTATLVTSALDEVTLVNIAAGVVALRGPQDNVVDVDNLVFDSY